MATEHGGDLFDFENMTDDEIRTVVLEQLNEYPNIEAAGVSVVVRNGRVTLSGSVGTDAEAQVADTVLGDILGLNDFVNELVVAEGARFELPEAADDAVIVGEEADDQLGEVEPHSDTAEHLHADLEAQTFGTHDLDEAMREGTTYIPPDRPTSEGYDSREDH